MVIVLLMAMLVPFLGAAKEQTYNTICQGNLEKLGQAIYTSGVTSGGALPSPRAWIGTASASGGTDILKCPKGYYRGGGGGQLGGSGNIVVMDPPPVSVVFNTPEVEDLTRIFAFKERESCELGADVTVDIAEPGYYTNNYGAKPKVISAGTMVDSYFLHYDSVGNQNTQTTGWVGVPEDIIGLIVTDGRLDASDNILGHPGTVYHTGRKNRGFENNAEQITFEPGRRKLTINRFQISYPGEDVRILTLPSGGEASYGMNELVPQKSPRMKQALLVEYYKMIIEPDEDDLEAWLAPRHFDKANVLFVDGSVRATWPDKLDPNAKIWQP